jgi:hypothetical protein
MDLQLERLGVELVSGPREGDLRWLIRATCRIRRSSSIAHSFGLWTRTEPRQKWPGEFISMR